MLLYGSSEPLNHVGRSEKKQRVLTFYPVKDALYVLKHFLFLLLAKADREGIAYMRPIATGVCGMVRESVCKGNRKGKVVYSSSRKRLTATGTRVPYAITQCYLPPGRGDIPASTPAEAGTRFSDPVGMQG